MSAADGASLCGLHERGVQILPEILIENGAKANFKGKDGASALTIAAEHGNVGVARVLLAKGADVIVTSATIMGTRL
jgi:ankyrin repeat protein